jgi:sugar phosphate isomerase/epimerase
MDWTAIAAKLRSMGVARFVLEHDNPSDQIRFATRSIATAKTF